MNDEEHRWPAYGQKYTGPPMLASRQPRCGGWWGHYSHKVHAMFPDGVPADRPGNEPPKPLVRLDGTPVLLTEVPEGQVCSQCRKFLS